ncbi:MAG: rane protein [Acidobacteria bacterium]|nr:rane protein [Acidobacteriota bacterium]
MSKLAIAIWLLSVVLDTAGRIAFKSAAVTGGTDGNGKWQRWRRLLRLPALWIGIVCFALEFVVWLALLSLIPLSEAMLLGSINIVAVALAGRVFYGERFEPVRVIGLALIVVGVSLAGVFG